MKVTVKIGKSSLVAELPFDNADHVVVRSASCPECGLAPLKVHGSGSHIESHDTYVARAICLGCGEYIGTLRARVSTIFGIEEDERVLNSRCRVY